MHRSKEEEEAASVVEAIVLADSHSITFLVFPQEEKLISILRTDKHLSSFNIGLPEAKHFLQSCNCCRCITDTPFCICIPSLYHLSSCSCLQNPYGGSHARRLAPLEMKCSESSKKRREHASSKKATVWEEERLTRALPLFPNSASPRASPWSIYFSSSYDSADP